MTEPTTPLVAVFASTRADLFPLASVLAALAASPDLDVVLFASGTTANPAFGDPLADIDLAGVRVEQVAADLDDSTAAGLTAGGARISVAVDAALDRLRPAAMVVLGDRWELLYAVPPAVLRGIPLVHIHGGEVTEGAVDDRIRHAVTKLADLHCVSTDRAAMRLRQLGETAGRVFVTGAPSLDRLDTIVPASDAELAILLGRPVQRPFALVTYHPSTAGGPDPGEGALALLSAVVAMCGSALVTAPGLDVGRDAVLEAVADATARWPQLTAVDTLGAAYLPVLASADVVVGNSSSGILEGASFGTPVVDVGDRQRGRDRGDNVLHANEDEASITAVLAMALDPSFRARSNQVVNPYGDGHAAPRIVRAIRRAVLLGRGLASKPFGDLPQDLLR